MNARAAWTILLLVVGGWAAGAAFGASLGLRGLDLPLGFVGALAGYGASRVVARAARPRGQIKYWRGQRFEE